MVKVKVGISINSICKVKNSVFIVVEYCWSSVPILRAICIPCCEAQDTGIFILFIVGVDYQIKGNFPERSPFFNCSQLIIFLDFCAIWETLPDQVWEASISWRIEVVSCKHFDIFEGSSISISNILDHLSINSDSVENLSIPFHLINLDVIQSVELNFMVKVKVGISINSICKVKNSVFIVVEYCRNSVPILRTICLSCCEAQDTGISLFIVGVDNQIKGDFPERSPFFNCSQ